MLSLFIVSNSYWFNQFNYYSNSNFFWSILTIFKHTNIDLLFKQIKKYNNTYTKNINNIEENHKQLNYKDNIYKINNKVKTINNIAQSYKKQEKKIIVQKVITLEEIVEKKDLCTYIYNVKDISKSLDYKSFNQSGFLNRKQFIFLDWRTKPFINKCYKLFSLNKQDIKKVNKRIIFFKEDSNKPFDLNSAIRLKLYKKYLLKQKIWLTIVYSHKYEETEKYNYHLYNLYYNKIFPGYFLKKDFIILKYRSYQNYKIFRISLNTIIDNYINLRKNFYKKYKIYQDTNPRTWYRNHDREKCGIYGLTEIITFNDYLSNVLFDLDNRTKFSNKKLKKTLKLYNKKIVNNLDYHKQLFTKLSIVYIKDFRKKNGIWVSEFDLIQYLNQFLNWFSNKYKIVYIKYKYLSDLTNPYLKDLFVSIDIKRNWKWTKWWHFWLRFCDVKNKCSQYWPDTWFIQNNFYRNFYWKKRIVEYWINFSMDGYYKLYN